MNKTATQEALESIAQSVPDPNLPAVRQERAPAAPSKEAKQFGRKSIKRAILQITKEIGRIQKAGFNDFLKYRFTRWEDINEKLSPLLAEHGLIIFRNEISRNLIEENDKGSTLAVIYEYTIADEDGQLDPIEGTGYARLRDQKGITDDKAGLKAATSAYKQFCVQQFGIRSEDDNTIEDERRPLRVEDMRPLFQKFLNEITPIETVAELDQWRTLNRDRVRAVLHDKWLGNFNAQFNEKLKDLEDKAREYHEYIDAVDEETGELRSAAPSAEKAAPATPSPPATVGAAESLDEEWVMANARVEAAKGQAAMNAWFSKQPKEAKEIMRKDKNKAELYGLYPKGANPL